jgi:hypothetical protein
MPTNRRMMMAVHTKNSLRMVAFDNVIDAYDAMDIVRQRDIRHVVGPKLIYNIPRLEDDFDNDVWEVSAIEVARHGLMEFVLDICTLDKSTACIQVHNSFSIVLQNMDRDTILDNLNKSWTA